MNNEIIQLKAKLRRRSKDYMKKKENKLGSTQVESVENAIDNVFNSSK